MYVQINILLICNNQYHLSYKQVRAKTNLRPEQSLHLPPPMKTVFIDGFFLYTFVGGYGENIELHECSAFL